MRTFNSIVFIPLGMTQLVMFEELLGRVPLSFDDCEADEAAENVLVGIEAL